MKLMGAAILGSVTMLTGILLGGVGGLIVGYALAMDKVREEKEAEKV